MPSKLFDDAFLEASLATEFESKNDFKSAIIHYKKAIEQFTNVLAQTSDARSKKLISDYLITFNDSLVKCELHNFLPDAPIKDTKESVKKVNEVDIMGRFAKLTNNTSEEGLTSRIDALQGKRKGLTEEGLNKKFLELKGVSVEEEEKKEEKKRRYLIGLNEIDEETGKVIKPLTEQEEIDMLLKESAELAENFPSSDKDDEESEEEDNSDIEAEKIIKMLKECGELDKDEGEGKGRVGSEESITREETNTQRLIREEREDEERERRRNSSYSDDY